MKHNNLFVQLIKMINPTILDSIVEAHEADKHSKKVDTKTQLITSIFMQIMNPHGLREMELQLKTLGRTLTPLGMNKVTRSSFSDANVARNADVFRDLALQMIARSRMNHGDLKECVSILDSSTIQVDDRGSQWAESTKILGGQGLKLHAEYMLHEGFINAIEVGPTNVNDITVAKGFELRDGWTYVFDKAYHDFNWWHKIHQSGAFFVTRAKKNSRIQVLQERAFDRATNPHIKSDSYVLLGNKYPKAGKINALATTTLRLVSAVNPDDNKVYSFITNNLSESPSQIAYCYKKRWEIELLFKWLKQNLKLKKFYCENENGIKIQIYAAIITHILLGELKRLSRTSLDRMIDFISYIKTTVYISTSRKGAIDHGRVKRCLQSRNLCLDLKQ